MLTRLHYVPKFYEVKFDPEASSLPEAEGPLLISSIFSVFLSFFISISLFLAEDLSGQCYLNNNLTGHRYFVNWQPDPLLCSARRFSTSSAIPVYNFLSLHSTTYTNQVLISHIIRYF